MMVVGRNLLFQGFIFGFHVGFQGCNGFFLFRFRFTPPKKNSQNKVTPRHTPVYRAACRLYTAYFPNLSSLIIHTDTYDIGWKRIGKWYLRNQKIFTRYPPTSPPHRLHTDLNATTARRSTFASQPSAIQHLLGSIAPSCEARTLWSGESTDYPLGEPWGDVGMLIFWDVFENGNTKRCLLIYVLYVRYASILHL